MTPALFLLIGNQPCNVLLINRGYNGARTELTLALTGLGSKNMARESTVPLDFTAGGLSEALGRAAVCLDLGHYSSPFLLVFDAVIIF